MMATKKFRVVVPEKSLPPGEQQAKINDVRKSIGSITSKFPVLCSDASILRYLKARNWNTNKASKMLKETLKWRLDYKPEKIQWEDVAHEAKIGKLYRANYFDKRGRTVLIMRPGLQSKSSTDVQIKYLVYCMERAILDLKHDQDQMVWLIDFQGWSMSSISVKVTRETAHLLQERYPESLALAILYDPPKVFESFWLLVKPFLEPKTYKKVKFVFGDNQQSRKFMEELFDMDKLESVFGGRNSIGFVYEDYAKRMMMEDKKISDSTDNECKSPSPSSMIQELQHSETNSDECKSPSPSSMIQELQHSETNSDKTSEASDDETGSSTFLEEVEEKIEGLSLNCKDAETIEADKKVEAAKLGD